MKKPLLIIDCVKLQRDIRSQIHQEFRGKTLEEQLKEVSKRAHQFKY